MALLDCASEVVVFKVFSPRRTTTTTSRDGVPKDKRTGHASRSAVNRSTLKEGAEEVGRGLIGRSLEMGVARQRRKADVAGASHHGPLINAGREQRRDDEVPEIVQPNLVEAHRVAEAAD